MYDVITVGSATIDVFARTRVSELIKIFDGKKERDLLAYPTGAKILVDELDFTTGGGGTNTAVAFSRLGHKVAYIGKMGRKSECANSDEIIASLRKENVDTSLVSRKKGRAGYSIILDSLEHDRTILAFKGLNNDLTFNEIDLRKLKTRWFYLSSMLEKSFRTIEKLSEYAKSNNIKVAFNPSSYLAEKGKRFLSKILGNTTLLVLNREEAELIVGKCSDKDAAIEISKLGPKIVVVTAGNRKFYAYDGKYLYEAIPDNIKPLETTGAGDAFAATFLSGIMDEMPVAKCIKRAIVNAQSVISYHGAKNKLLTKKEIDNAVRKSKSRVKKLGSSRVLRKS